MTRSGQRIGAISGGCLEEDLAARAERVLQLNAPECVLYDTTSENDLVWGVGLGCHGTVRILLEPLRGPPSWLSAWTEAQAENSGFTLRVRYAGSASLGTLGTFAAADPACPAPDNGVFEQVVPPARRLVVFGAGNDVVPLVRFAAELGWQVIVADPRSAFARAERFAPAHTVLCCPAEDPRWAAWIDARSAVVIMSHHYIHDLPALRVALTRTPAYLGVLGPRQRAERLLADLTLDSAERASLLARLHAPVGLDLGGDQPEAVALCIVAEIQACFAGRTARPLREKRTPIHA